MIQEEVIIINNSIATINQEITTINRNVTNLQTTTEYQSVGSTIYNGLHIPGPENFTQFSSAIRLKTNDLFSNPPVIHTDGFIECVQILPNVNNHRYYQMSIIN